MRILVVAAALMALLALGPSRAAERAPVRLLPVGVYFQHGEPGPRCDRVVRRIRRVPAPAVLAGALRQLLAGPSAAERRAGYGGWFSSRTAGFLRGVSIRAGVARVDLRNLSRVIPNASSSCGSALLLAQLDRTATQFPTVRHAVYSFDGSRRAFYEWLQREPPRLLSVAPAPPRLVRLGAHDSGRTLHLRVRDLIEIRLDANASTGYAWRYLRTGAPVLRLVSTTYVPPDQQQGLVGVPGTFVSRLRVAAPGTARVTLGYVRRTTPPSKPTWSFGFRAVATRG